MKIKFSLILTVVISLYSPFSAADISDWTDDELCKNLANYYVKGASAHWFKAIKEIRKRNLGLRCKEVAELQMVAARYVAVPPFKEKLNEMFGPTPQIHSDEYFMAKERAN